MTHAHEHKPTQAQRAGFGYMVGHVRLETVEITSPVPKTQPFCPWGGYTSGPEHHIQTISITRALHAFKWNRHDRQICVITVTRSKLHMHRVRPSKGYQVFNSHIGRACPSHCDPPESGGNNDNRMCQSCMQKHRSVEPVPSILNQFLPFCLGVHGTQEPRADETAR